VPAGRPGPSIADRLLGRIATGDQAAFAELFDEFAPRVCRRIRAVLRDAAQSEEALALAFAGNHTHAEVAEKLQVPLGTVISRIHDGLRHLRRALEEAS
jgi:DNA-directed RNA polymerase specialized sigma24 family protein